MQSALSATTGESRPSSGVSRTQPASRPFGRWGMLLTLLLLVGCAVHAPQRRAHDGPRPSPPPAESATQAGVAHEATVRIKLLGGQEAITLVSEAPLRVIADTGLRRLPPGAWRFTIQHAAPPVYTHYVFVTRFDAREQDAAQAHAAEWRQRGYDAEVFILGHRIYTRMGRPLDNRQFWVALGRFDAPGDAEALRAALAARNQWAWTRERRAAPGRLETIAVGPGGVRAAFPGKRVEIEADGAAAIAVRGASGRETRHAGAILLEAGPDRRMEVYEHAGLETYLKGVLPNEVPALWPEAALKAQAVAARTESLANRIDKHFFDGYDFCIVEHCRMYGGIGTAHPATTHAVRATEGQALTHGGRLPPAVFSANCGGHTENNEAIWAAEADPALRGRPDSLRANPGPSPAVTGIGDWLSAFNEAYCAGDADHFRWTRRLTGAELTEAVNRYRAIGPVRGLELGPRGASGRLTEVRVFGAAGEATFEREGAIRQALGGLPSAMFTVRQEGAGSGVVYVFRGGGRGHGAGLCQHGAKGRAEAGHSYAAILMYYFAGSRIESLY